MLLTLIKNFINFKKIQITLLLILMTFSQLITIVIPLLSSKLIDNLIKKNISNCILMIKLSLIALMLNLIIQYFYKVIRIKNQQQLVFLIQSKLLTNIYNSRSFDRSSDTSTFLSQITLTDSDIIANFIFENIFDFFSNFLMIIISLILLFKINILFFIIALFSIPFYIILILTMQPKVTVKMNTSKRAESEYTSKIINIFQSMITIKELSNIDNMMNLINHKFKDMFFNYMKTYKYLYLFYSIGTICTSSIQIIYYIIGIFLVTNNKLSVGEFTIVLSFYNFLLASVNYFLNFFEKYNDFYTSWNRIHTNFSRNFIFHNGIRLDDIFSIKTKYFSLKLGDKSIKFPSFNISKGEILLINGENGVGKTTLLRIISGVYYFKNQEIKFNDISIDRINMDFLRTNTITICSTNFSFVMDDVISNIKFYLNDNSISKHQILNFIRKHKLDKLFNHMEDILDSRIDTLSTGQLQKIALLISFIKPSSLLILDEPTLGLDKNSKNELIIFLKKIKSNKIILIVSHEKIFESISTQSLFIG